MNRNYTIILVILMCTFLSSGCQKVVIESKPIEDVPVVASENVEGVESTEALGQNPLNKSYTKVELQADFNILKESILNIHPKLYTDQEALKVLIETQYEQIVEGMTERQFLQLLKPIVSKLNCGHTYITNSAACDNYLMEEATYFPLPIIFREGHAYIVQNGLDSTVPVGAELLSINGHTMQAIRETLFTFLSADGVNKTHKDYQLNRGFIYDFQSFVDDSESFNIVYKPLNAEQPQEATVQSATLDSINEKNKPTDRDRSTPYESIFGEDYAVLTMYAFYPYGSFSIAKYKAFMDDFFLQVKEKHIDNVILDVRENQGGDPFVTSHLFSYLAKTSQPYFAPTAMDYYSGLKSDVPIAENRFTGNLFTLISGGSFSSTGHLLALLKYQNVGTFIGEESGGSFACTDSSTSLTLANTKIRYNTSTAVWEVAVEGLTPGRGIMPDYTVIQPLEDYLAGKDTVMAYAVELIIN